MLLRDCLTRLPSASRRPGCQFALRSLLVFALVGLLTHMTIEARVTAHFRQQVDFHGAFVASNLVDPTLMQAPTDEDLGRALQRMAARDDQVVSLVLLDATGEVRAEATLARLAPSEEMTATHALLGGHRLRVVQDWRPAAHAAADLTRTIDLLLASGLLALWATLLPLASRLGRDLRRRTEELERQHVEVHRLLGQEQETVTRLRELGEMKDHFLSAVSHELRTPLTIVKGAVDTLQARHADLSGDQRQQLLARAGRSATKLETLLIGLLDLNRAADHAPRTREEVDLAEVVAEVRSHLPDRDVRLRLAAPVVLGDPLQVERIVANLLGNAVRHAPGEAAIEISSRRDGDQVEVVVADRGPGVPDDLKQAVFEPFRQGDIADPHSPGTGIGLSLVARFAKDHGGRAWVCDRAGGGASFHVRLPAPATAMDDARHALTTTGG